MTKPTIEIVHGDALAWLDEESSKVPRFDLIVTDPPYDSLMKWQGIGTTARMGFGKNKDAEQSDKFFPTINSDQMRQVLACLYGLSKPNSHTYILCDGEYMPRILGWVRDLGQLSWNYSKALVWDKINAGMGYHWRGTHEYIVMLEKGKRRLNDVGAQDVLRYKRVTGCYPTEKPFGLIEALVLNSSKEGDWVLDPFCGGGTTAAVCQKHNRNCVTIDISERAIKHTRERLEMDVEQQILKLNQLQPD